MTCLFTSKMLKAPIMTAADNIHQYFHCFSEKIRLDISCESPARQRIHIKHQGLFLLKHQKKKKKKLKCRLLQILFGALRVIIINIQSQESISKDEIENLSRKEKSQF